MAKAKIAKEAVEALAKKLGGTYSDRMARAADMGFDTKRVLYHGSPKENIAGFKLGPHDETAINSLSLTYDPGYAEKYAMGGYGRHGHDYINPDTGKFSEWIGESGVSPTIYPVYVRGKTPDFMDAVDIYEAKHGLNSFQKASPEDFAKSMSEEGVSGVSMFGDEIAMLDPTAIRSINADFNPANKDSPNLLASVSGAVPYLAGGAIAAGALAPQQSQAAQDAEQLRSAHADFAAKRESKRDFWESRKRDVLELANGVGGFAENVAFPAMDKPMQGIYGMTGAMAALARGQGWDNAIQQGAMYARQPVEQTAYNMGGVVSDALSPYLPDPVAAGAGTAVNVAGQVVSPF